MDIVNLRVVQRFARRHVEYVNDLERWAHLVASKHWRSPHEAERTMSGVKHIGRNRLVFRVHSNRLRIVAKVNYISGTLEVRFVGNHKEYDSINATEV